MECGVNLIGYIRAEMGLGEAARGLARSLEASNTPFAIIDYEYENPARKQDDSWAHKIVDQPLYKINILHVNADHTPQAYEILPSEIFLDRYTIGYWAWELAEFPDEWVHAFTFVDEVWVPSDFVHQALYPKSPVPVRSVPHAVEQTTPSVSFGRDYFGLPLETFLFLVMYDVHSVRQRKNPDGAIKAFQEAFSPGDKKTGLVVKINNAVEMELTELKALRKGFANIHFISDVLSRHMMDSLLAACDCYVSLHRAEGFGLSIAEAMSLGKPVIVTNWSGSMDFTTPANSACVDYELTSLSQDFGPYKTGQLWAEPNLSHAAYWMRELRENQTIRANIGRAARKTIEQQLSSLVVGKQVHRRVMEICRAMA